jgi:hypothetical protein
MASESSACRVSIFQLVKRKQPHWLTKKGPYNFLRLTAEADPIILGASVVIYCCSVFTIWWKNRRHRWQSGFLFVGLLAAIIAGGLLSNNDEEFVAVFLIWGIEAAVMASWLFHKYVSACWPEDNGVGAPVVLAEKPAFAEKAAVEVCTPSL